jgi:hypothetical protein
MRDLAATTPLVPAKAGTQCFGQELDSRFRGNERRTVLVRSKSA